jgi:hypothetical protein
MVVVDGLRTYLFAKKRNCLTLCPVEHTDTVMRNEQLKVPGKQTNSYKTFCCCKISSSGMLSRVIGKILPAFRKIVLPLSTGSSSSSALPGHDILQSRGTP